jgi:hypothetical protein
MDNAKAVPLLDAGSMTLVKSEPGSLIRMLLHKSCYGSGMPYKTTTEGLRAAARESRVPREQLSVEADANVTLCDAWIALMRALPERTVELAGLYEQNPMCFDMRGLDNLLGVTRRGKLSNALRYAGFRESASGPLPELGGLQLRNCASLEIWTIRGAVAAWHVATSARLSNLSARELGESLLRLTDGTALASISTSA